MEALETRRVVLAGIREARLDLFLLLNEGAGYEVAAVVESSTTGESSRIAEILGVRVYQEHDADALPAADLLIFGDQRYRFLGERMGLSPDRVWGEDEAWANLTEADRESLGEPGSVYRETPPPTPEPMSDETAPPFGSHLEEIVAGPSEPERSAHAPSSEYPSVSVPELISRPVEERDMSPPAAPSATSFMAGTDPSPEPMSPEEPHGAMPIPEAEISGTSDPVPMPESDPSRDLEPEPVSIAPEPEPAPEVEPMSQSVSEVARSARADHERVGSHHADPLVLLRDFARAGHGMESFYEWVLGHAMKLTGAAAGGLAPHEPVRPYVWNDRRATPRGERPAFLKPGDHESEFQSFAFGEPGSPGAARLILVGTEPGAGSDLPMFLGAVAPALRTVAELEDLRRESAWGGVVRRLVDGLAHADAPDHALTETCRELAALLGARECTLLFRQTEGDRFRGVSSSGHHIDVPAGSGLFAGAAATDDRPVRLVDDVGTWHYRIPFGDSERRGVLGLFGVGAAPGTVESIGHQAVALAQALADHFPDSAWG